MRPGQPQSTFGCPQSVAAYTHGHAADVPCSDELLDRGGAESVSGGDEDAFPALFVVARELCDGGRFARAVDSDDEDYVGRSKPLFLGLFRKHLQQLLFHRGEERVGIGIFLRVGLEFFNKFRRHGSPKIGFVKELFELGKGGFVELFREEGPDLLAERRLNF